MAFPTDIEVTGGLVREGSRGGTLVATLAARDPDAGDTFTYEILNDPSGFFEISGSSVVVKDGATLDFETGQSHLVRVQVTDSSGGTYFEDVTVNVLDVNEVTGTEHADRDATALHGTIGDDIIDGLEGSD